VRALASPASCKGVLSAVEAAMALAAGMRAAGVDAEELPVADGGEGTAEVFAAALGGEWRSTAVSGPLGAQTVARYLVLEDGGAVVEAAEAIGLRLVRDRPLDPLSATSRGLGELMALVARETSGSILVGLGDTATVDGGAGLLEAVGEELGGRDVQVLCDVRSPLLGERGAARAFGPQKGASPAQVDELERRLSEMDVLRPFAQLPGAGAAGGLGAALASLGARLVPGAQLVLERIDFRAQAAGADLVVTGEGAIDRSSIEGKAVGEVLRACRELSVRCELFGGRVDEAPPGTSPHALSGDESRAADDLVELGGRLGRALLGVA
jgi:glycerate kinase